MGQPFKLLALGYREWSLSNEAKLWAHEIISKHTRKSRNIVMCFDQLVSAGIIKIHITIMGN